MLTTPKVQSTTTTEFTGKSEINVSDPVETVEQTAEANRLPTK